MYPTALRFLSLRALGAPAVVVSLALQGVLRGFKDTKTPVICLGKCSLSYISYNLPRMGSSKCKIYSPA